MPRPRLAVPLAALALFTLASAMGLGQPPFLPEEAARVAAPGNPWSLSLDLAPILPLGPEVLARLPALALTLVAAVFLTLAAAREGRRESGLVLAVTSPVCLASARLAAPPALALALGSAAVYLLARRDRRGRAGAGALLLVALGVTAEAPPEAGGERLLAGVFSAWGLILGPGVPPWRLDLALPALGCALPLLWLGSASNARERTLRSLGIFAAAGAVGLLSARPTFASLAAAGLSPLCLHWIGRAVAALPARVPRAALGGVAAGVAAMALLNLMAARDVLDPARRVAWDEAARMMAAMTGAGGAAVLAQTPVPAPLLLYAPGRTLPRSAAGGALPGLAVRRVLVPSAGIRGGLERPEAASETKLESAGYELRGELAMGEIEPPMRALVRALTGFTPAPTYLRIRRYERPLAGED